MRRRQLCDERGPTGRQPDPDSTQVAWIGLLIDQPIAHRAIDQSNAAMRLDEHGSGDPTHGQPPAPAGTEGEEHLVLHGGDSKGPSLILAEA